MLSHKKLVITINGGSPGPTIFAQQGDKIIVEVTNKLFTDGVTIHWHGIRQFGTPWSDGREGVTQCPIVPGDTFKYEFKVERAGTYLYHAHYGMQRESGLYGSIRVSVPDKYVESYDPQSDPMIHDSTYSPRSYIGSRF